MSPAGLDFIAGQEGFKSNVYYVGGKGNPTIGYGHELQPGEILTVELLKHRRINF